MTAALEEAPPVTADEAPIPRATAASRLGVSVVTLDRYAAEGRLTRTKNPITKRVTFDPAEVEAFRRARDGA